MNDSGNSILRTLFILIWVITLTHIVAESKHLYWNYLWLDIPMHMLGGIWIGLAILWFRNHTEYCQRFWRRVNYHDLLVVVVGGIGIGFAWEAYEFVVWQYTGLGLPTRYVADTSLDIIVDAVGAGCGYVFYKFLNKSHAK